MENILGGTEMKRKIISIMLSIAIVITGIQLPVIKKAVLAKENVLNKFDAYYTAHSDNVKDYPAKKVIKSDYWEEDGAGVITRTAKDTTTETNSQNPNYDGNPYPDMAMLYYNIKQYKDFTVEVEYKNPNKGRGAAWLGFGGKVTDDTANTWCTENGATIFGTSGEKTDNLIGTYIPWQKSNKGAKTDGSTLWDTDISGADWGTEWNAVKIIVKDGVINFYTKVGSEWKAAWGDDKFYYGDWYKGGYIFLASNNAGTQFRNFKIEEIKDTNILKNFNGYYTEDTKGNSSVADVVSKEKYWTEDENGILTRTSKNTTANVGDAYKNMAYLFYNVKEYEEFSLEVDYKNADPKKGGAWVGFDGKIEDDVAKTWFGDGQGTMIAANGKNEVNLVGTFGNGDKPKITTYNTTKRVWKTEVEGADWTKAEWKTIKIEVKKGKINFQIKNNGKWYTVYEKEELLYDTWYDGGYIFLASNHAGTQFRNLKVKEIKRKNSILDDFEPYYTAGCDKQKPKATRMSYYWKADKNGVITRKGMDLTDNLKECNDGNPYPNMAILYSKKIYKDFTMNLEYKNPAGDRGGAWIGFDGERGKTWTDKNSGTMWCTCGTNGIKMAGTFTAYNGVKWDSALWDYWLDKADFNARWIKAKLVVKNGEIKYYIKIKGKWKLTWDTADYANPLYYTDWYDGGRIFLAANELGVQYRNIKIKEEKSTNDFSRFNSYYSECVENQPLVKVDPGKYWYEDKGVLIRKNEELGEFQGKEWNLSNYQQNKMAYMFLNGNYVYSDNWQLDVDVTLGNSAWKRFYIGYGATDTVTWRKPNGGTVFWTDDNGGVCMEGNYASNEQIYGDTAESIKNFEKNKAHHYRIVAKAGVVHLYIDGIQVKEYVQQKYQKGGRVFFASNSVNTTFSNISIKTLESDFSQSSWSGYKEYYSSDITKNALTKVQEGTNWAIEDGVIRRKAQEPGMDDCRNYLDMAYLYLNDKKYTNFKLELDYKNGNSGWHRAPIGFGAKMGRHFMEEGGGITALVQPDGYVHFDGNNQSDGAFEEHVFWPVYDEKGNDVSTLKPYDETKWHHMVMEVADGYVTVTVDGFKYVYEMALPSYYNGGYIYLAANSVWAEYKNIKIEDYSEMYNSDDKGWIPKREDIEYDFEYREKEENNSIWSWIYKEL